MGIFKNVIIPASAIFVLGIFFLLNLLKPAPMISLEPEIPADTAIEELEPAQEKIVISEPETAKTLPPPAKNIKLLPKPATPIPAPSKPVPPKTIENKIPLPIMPAPLMTQPITSLLPLISSLLPAETSTALSIKQTEPVLTETPPRPPPINEDDLMNAVVRIRCENIYGTGFVINPQGLVLTVAHVIIEAVEKRKESCDVIFPAKNPNFGFFSEAHYRKGTILTPQETKKLYKEQALDVAALQTSFLENDPVFPETFPYINYPFCGPDTLKDKILLFGYAANLGTSPISPGSILSRFEGEVLQYEDVTGVKADYFPESTGTTDESVQHPITIIFSNNNFSGASGGLVFNVSKNCIIGANSAAGTISGDPKVYGFIFNFNFPAVKAWVEPFFNQ